MTGKNKSTAMTILFFLTRVRFQASKFVSVAGDFFCDFSLVGFFCRQIIVNGLRYLGGQCGIGTVVMF